MKVMMSLITAEFVLFDEEKSEILFEMISPQQGKVVDFVIGVDEGGGIFDLLEDLGEL